MKKTLFPNKVILTGPGDQGVGVPSVPRNIALWGMSPDPEESLTDTHAKYRQGTRPSFTKFPFGPHSES